MAKYFKNEASGSEHFLAFHGEPQKAMSQLMGTPHYSPVEECGFYLPGKSPFYEVSTVTRPIRSGLTPCTRQEFETAKAAALAAIAALMDAEKSYN